MRGDLFDNINDQIVFISTSIRVDILIIIKHKKKTKLEESTMQNGVIQGLKCKIWNRMNPSNFMIIVMHRNVDIKINLLSKSDWAHTEHSVLFWTSLIHRNAHIAHTQTHTLCSLSIATIMFIKWIRLHMPRIPIWFGFILLKARIPKLCCYL